MLTKLPPELLRRIIAFLEPSDYRSFRDVSRYLRSILSKREGENLMFRDIDPYSALKLKMWRIFRLSYHRNSLTEDEKKILVKLTLLRDQHDECFHLYTIDKTLHPYFFNSIGKIPSVFLLRIYYHESDFGLWMTDFHGLVRNYDRDRLRVYLQKILSLTSPYQQRFDLPILPVTTSLLINSGIVETFNLLK